MIEDDGELPEGWASTSVGEISAAIQYGYTASAMQDANGPRFLRITDIQNGTVNWDAVPSCEIGNEDLSRFAVKPGDIVFARTGATTGKSYLIRKCPKAVFASYLIRLRPRAQIEPAFLSFFFQTPDYWQLISDNVSGNAQPNCNASKLAELPLPLPPLAEQKRIVAKVEEVLGQVTAARERLAKVPAILKRFRQSVLAAASSGRLTEDWRGHSHSSEVEDDELPASWRQRELSDICADFDYGSSQKSSSKGSVPVLRMGNIQNGQIDWSDLVFSNDPNEIKKYSLAPNTVLFNRTNSPELVGKTAIYRGERAAIFAGYLIRLVPGPELDPRFLNLSLNSPDFKEYCLQVRTDGVSQSNINATKLAEYWMNWCPLTEQREIVRRVEALFARADAIEQRVTATTQRVERLTQAVLAKAFRGELVPTEAELARREKREYEPASVLLERIRAEQTEGPAKPARKQRRKERT